MSSVTTVGLKVQVQRYRVTRWAPCRREHHDNDTVEPFRSVRGENIARGLVCALVPNEVFPEIFPGNQVKSVLLLACLAAVAAGGRAARARARGAAARRALGGAGAGAARAAAVGIAGAGHDGLSVLLKGSSVLLEVVVRVQRITRRHADTERSVV